MIGVAALTGSFPAQLIQSFSMIRTAAATIFAMMLYAAADTAGGVKELAPGVFVRMGDRTRNQPANCGWVVFRDYVVVIDANFPWGAREILAAIRKTTSKPIRFVFNTHYHGDHAYGSSVFADEGAAIVCSQACGEESRTKGQAGWDRNTATGDYSLKPYRLVHPALTFAQSMAFDDGERRVELTLMGPGHSRGDSVAFLPREKILFTGDLAVNWNFGNNFADADADHDNWLQALERMMLWDVQTLVPGHGDLGALPALRAQHAYLKAMLDSVRQGIAQGKTPEQIAAGDFSAHRMATDKDRNLASVRAVHRKLSARR
jgi:glyoxylase-like metal-dependent hydrolase (beta-lactamase superfamily II)